MKATATDSLSDVITTCVVLLSTLVGRFTQLQLDGWCGALVAVFILRAGYNAAKDTLTPLLGTAPDPEYVQQIQQTVMAHPEVLGIHDLIVHDYGPGRRMISLHAEVPSNGDLLQLHDTIDQIERELNHLLGCDAVIHMDPIVTDDETVTQLRQIIADHLREKDSRMTIHDFRMVQGPTHTNVIFDVVVPSDYKGTDSDAQKMVEQVVKDAGDNLFPVIQVDKAYV